MGNARTFLLAWLSIRSQNGIVKLRIEDIDSPRVKPWAIQQAVEDLQWLGLDWDAGFADGSESYLQSHRLDRYEEYLTQLKAREQVYPCTCTRTDVAESASAPHEFSDGPVYGRICFARQASDASQLENPYGWRFRCEDRTVLLQDGLKGALQCNLQKALGDFVVFKSDGTPAYQLSVVVDDHEMGVTEVLRGDDLVQSAFRQLALFDFFGWEAPRFIHVPLVVGPDGRRLAKRHGDTRLSHFREQGVRPERILGLLAYSLGWLSEPEEISSRELIGLFNLSTIPPEPFTVGGEQMAWLMDPSAKCPSE